MLKTLAPALLVLLLLPLQSAVAENLVRVEVVVFKYSQGQSDAWPVDRLPDFSALRDPRGRRSELAMLDENEAGRSWLAPDPGPSQVQDARSQIWPERFAHEDGLSSTMQRALDRLNASASHEVLSVTAWLQPLDRRNPTPALRIRSDNPLDNDKPVSRPSRFPLGTGLSLQEQAPPAKYRLDGSVRIRQRQFRHAELDLVWTESRALAAPGAFASTADYEIHRLTQSRPIQLGRLEYFDSPLLGVLVLVEPWQAPPSPAQTGG